MKIEEFREIKGQVEQIRENLSSTLKDFVEKSSKILENTEDLFSKVEQEARRAGIIQ
jgi:hypothetical protein